MRRWLILIVLALAGCDSDGNGMAVPPSAAAQHIPVISNLVLQPASAFEAEGGGAVTVTATIDFSDAGLDVSQVMVAISDGTNQDCVYDQPMAGAAAQLSCEFEMSTVAAGDFEIEFWLVDSNGDSSSHWTASFVVNAPLQHAPVITGLSVSPTSAFETQGGGAVTVTATIDVSDRGLDVSQVMVAISDGTSDDCDYDQPMASAEARLLCEFQMSTAVVGTYKIEFWVVDSNGDSSDHWTTDFIVYVLVSDEWTGQLTGLPFALNDVLWHGNGFVAVGDDGKVLTSADGIDWVERESGTDVNLNAIGSYGNDLVAVGDAATVLLSLDHGESWSVKHEGDQAGLRAIVMNATQLVVGGMGQQGGAFIMRSTDRGNNWRVVDSLPEGEHFLTDLVYANGLFIAATDYFNWQNNARVFVSVDGENWQDVVVRDAGAPGYGILHDGTRFILAGGMGTVFASVDGYLWSQLPTPITEVDYMGITWTGAELVTAGGITWWYWWMGPPPWQRDVGLTSADGGATWEAFNIAGYYESRGIAWGAGRLVSVGRISPISQEGAIYTSP